MKTSINHKIGDIWQVERSVGANGGLKVGDILVHVESKYVTGMMTGSRELVSIKFLNPNTLQEYYTGIAQVYWNMKKLNNDDTIEEKAAVKPMNIFVFKEVKDGENRVAMTPEGVKLLVHNGHSVIVDDDAGVGSGYTNHDYRQAGARIACEGMTRIDALKASDLFVKVKEPTHEEMLWFPFMRDKTLMTFLHLSDNPILAEKLNFYNITGVSYDTLEDDLGRLPLLKPMSEIAGKFAIDFWEKDIADKKIKKALILGGGVSGKAAAERCVELGVPDVVIYEKMPARCGDLLRDFDDTQVDVFSCNLKLPRELMRTDLLVGCVLVKGEKAPVVVGPDLLDLMRPGSRIIDVAIDQGGCIWGSHATSHKEPTFELNGKVYCCIPNMPGARPREATQALTSLTINHIFQMAQQGAYEYLNSTPGLKKAINTHNGVTVNETVAAELLKNK